MSVILIISNNSFCLSFGMYSTILKYIAREISSIKSFGIQFFLNLMYLHISSTISASLSFKSNNGNAIKREHSIDVNTMLSLNFCLISFKSFCLLISLVLIIFGWKVMSSSVKSLILPYFEITITIAITSVFSLQYTCL